MKSKRIKWLVLAVIIVAVGAGYYTFATKSQELAEQKIGESLHKVGTSYSKLDCKGLYSIKCIVSDVSFVNGAKAEKIVYKNVQQFAKVAENKSAKVNLDISVIGVDASSLTLKQYEKLASIMHGRRFQDSDYDKISDIAQLLLKGDMYIKGDLEFIDKKMKNFKDISIDYSNEVLPFRFTLSGHSRNIAKRNPLLNLLFNKVSYSINLKNLKTSYKKIAKIVFPNKNTTDAQFNKTWDESIKKIIAHIEKQKKIKKDKLSLQSLNAVENVLSGNSSMIKLTFKSKEGISVADIIKYSKGNIGSLIKKTEVTVKN